jgi:hypothetical protein
MPQPEAGVAEAIAAMERSDWAGCIRAARSVPATSRTLQVQFTCGLQSDRGAARRACEQHATRFPEHPFSRSCQQIVATF